MSIAHMITIQISIKTCNYEQYSSTIVKITAKLTNYSSTRKQTSINKTIFKHLKIYIWQRIFVTSFTSVITCVSFWRQKVMQTVTNSDNHLTSE